MRIRRSRRRDHPRSRGVYGGSDDDIAGLHGSSPLARGLRNQKRDQQRPARIIPARAGFTLSPACPTSRSTDHPRSRGVYEPLVKRICCWPGSSPLARGLRPRRDGVAEDQRIIPARAGFTGPPPKPGRWRTDHPRSRGVYVLRSMRRSAASGSSPLARGLPAFNIVSYRSSGIIPARAGFTQPC